MPSFIQYIRDYNDWKETNDPYQVSFFKGMDLCSLNRSTTDVIIKYFETVDPEGAKAARKK